MLLASNTAIWFPGWKDTYTFAKQSFLCVRAPIYAMCLIIARIQWNLYKRPPPKKGYLALASTDTLS